MSQPTSSQPPGGGDFERLCTQALRHLIAGSLDAGIAALEQALALKTGSRAEQAELHNHLGTAHWQSGRPEVAEKNYRRALALAPDHPLVLNNAGAFLLEQWRLDEAEKLLTRAHALMPGHYEIPNNLGLLYYRRGRPAEAGPLFVAAIRLQPAWPVPYGNLANVLRDLGRFAEAEDAYRQSLKLHPGNAVAWRDLGKLFMECNRDAEAYGCLKRSLELNPLEDTAWVWLLGLLEGLNRLDEAAGMLAEARRHVPDCVGVLVFEAKLLGRDGKTEEALALMEKCLDAMKDSPDRRSHPFVIGFFSELGLLYDRRGDAAKAFACFREANSREAGGPAARLYDRTQLSRDIAMVREKLTAKKAREMLTSPVAPEGPSPVFLVGFPRSGTTLLDQILSSHPDIQVAEEKLAVDKMALYLQKAGRCGDGAPADLVHAAGLAPARPEDIEEMRRLYFQEHGKHLDIGGKKVFVDKLPLNMLHAGLIRRVFPDAKFLLALRHPCDTVLSCFMQSFALNPAMVRFLDLEDTARFYDEAFGLWNQYADLFPLEAHTVRYEDVVADFRPAVGGMLDFLGLPWNDVVLDFDKTARARGRINTPSYTQVTQKLYTRASGRWLRYRRQLEPVLDILAPHAARHGYAMDETSPAS